MIPLSADRATSIGRMRVTFLLIAVRLSPTRPTGCCRAVPDRVSPPPYREPGRHRRHSANGSKMTAPEPGRARSATKRTPRRPGSRQRGPDAQGSCPGHRQHVAAPPVVIVTLNMMYAALSLGLAGGPGPRHSVVNLTAEYPRNRESMHVRARHGPGPARLWSRTRRLPTTRRVRPPPDSSALADTHRVCRRRPPGAPARRQRHSRPRRPRRSLRPRTASIACCCF